MAHKFKIGDVVKCTNKAGRNGTKGASGIVKGFSTWNVLVEFFANVDGHNGKHFGFNVKDGHGWFCSENELVLCKRYNAVEEEE